MRALMVGWLLVGSVVAAPDFGGAATTSPGKEAVYVSAYGFPLPAAYSTLLSATISK